MLTVSSSSKVYVCCFNGLITGGVELAHQLVSILNENDIHASIVYVDDKGSICDHPKVPEEYSHYNLNVATLIEDDPQNVLVLFEAIFHKYREYTHCQLIFWWLSVDNFYTCSSHFLSLSDYLKLGFREWFYQFSKRIYRLAFQQRNTFRDNFTIKELSESRALNCYQSIYAQHFLLNHHFPKTLPLSDYINTEFITDDFSSGREDKILFNPKKGYAFTNKIRKATPHLKWVKLEGMTRHQLQEQFQTSKLYVDFGNHPGKDRIPREAAINGCCIMTNQRGSAKNFEDVSVPVRFKINDKKTTKEEIIALIEEVLKNYEAYKPEFDFYRKRILEEKKIFEMQVKAIFGIG
ncbi:MAG: hypothetical protein H7Y13_16080 [Sphingobacteriaceae bacterium]|nr:hypothetical protein [Sphingobacteriaceae bacterium]